MQFTRVIGKVDPKLVAKAEEQLSKVFLELGTRYNNEHVGSGMGGDPLIFTLLYPVDHICTMNMPTAATDGKRYYWNPKFILQKSRIGLRIIAAHEAWHAIYMHPQRRGSRLPKLWNIAVDYIVNGMIMEDFKARKMDADKMFTQHLGKYMTLENYAKLIQNPFATIPGFEDLNPTEQDKSSGVELPGPMEDRELTTQEQEELEKRAKAIRFYYADPNLSDDMKSPERIYDYLYSLLPKCPKCGSIGMYKKPQKQDKKKGKDKKDKDQNKDQGDEQDQGADQDKKKDKGKSKGDQDNHEHGPDGEPCEHEGECGCDNQSGDQPGNGSGDCDHGCDQCGDGVDVFGLGGTVDDHMDTEESEEKLAKRVSDAMESARKMAGHIPGALEDELGKLTAPKITWQDCIRSRLIKARSGNGRNDWTRFRSRPMFTGLMIPKKRHYFANFGCLLDTSGSMSKDDMAFGLSQLCSLDDRAEGTIVPGDCTIYWDKATKIKKANAEEIAKVKVMGRGGTMYSSFFTDYEKNIGKCDFLIIVSDMYLLDTDVAEMRDPGVDVFWISTSGNTHFAPPFGKIYNLKE